MSTACFYKKDILEEKALEIQNKADLTTPEGVAKAKKEFNDFYAAEVYGELEKSPAFNKIIKDLEVVGADVAGELNKEWGRYNDEFLRGIDESSFWSPGGVKERAYKGIKSFKSAIDKTMLSGEQLAFQKSDEELKDLVEKAFTKSPQVLVEKDLRGWKEIECSRGAQRARGPARSHRRAARAANQSGAASQVSRCCLAS